MVDRTSTVDIDTTIALLQQDFASIPIEEIIFVIERWQHQLQGTDLFEDLGELKQAILDVRTTAIAEILVNLGEDVTAAKDIPPDVAPKLEQLGAILAQVGNTLIWFLPGIR